MKKYSLLIVLAVIHFINLNAQGTWTNYTTNDGLADNCVKAICEDNSGNIWFGTLNGVSKYDGSDWTTYTTVDGLAFNEVLSIFKDSHENIWFGTFGSGASKYDGSTWTTYFSNVGLGAYVYSFFEDSISNIWIGTSAGVTIFDGVNWNTWNTQNSGLVDYWIRSVIVDKQGNMWAATQGYGVSKFNISDSLWTTYTTSNGLANNTVWKIFQDSNNNIWFGTYNGISMFNGSTWTNYTTTSGLIGNDVRAIIEDENNNLWFASYYDWYNNNGGVSEFNGTNWTTYTTAEGLVENGTQAIFEDSHGNIWIGTNQGVSKYTPESLRIKKNNKSDPDFYSVFPNPAEKYININFNELFDKELFLEIISVDGKRIFSKKYTPANLSLKIDISDYSSGMYFLNVKSDDKISIKQFYKY
ncbi:MAG: two-component regulator propeller domain-containing protein [Bacteroidota bacterium]